MIKLENVSKYYVGNSGIALGLRKLNLEFELGEMVAITGESGSGKSTLLNVLSGSISYDDGEMYINNCPTSYFDEKDWEEYRRDHIGFIYQNYNLIDSYTVYENVNAALVIKGSLNGNNEKILDYLDKVGIKELAYKKASQLSSGQKQRLAIARALAKETDIIVADEPTGNLDSVNSAEVMELLSKLAEDKLVFVVTHNYNEIEPYATRKIRMYDGEVAEDINIRPKKLSGESIGIKESEHLAGNDEKNDLKQKKKISTKIVNLNRKNKPMTFAFLMIFMISVSFSIFILLGGFFVNLDDTTSRIFRDDNFKNRDITRIVVRKNGDKILAKDDVEKIRDIKYVEQTDLFDSVSDTFYLLEENVDYKIKYLARDNMYQPPNSTRPYAIKKDKYMKTISCLSDEDLKDGYLAEELYDIVLYSEDESVLGTTISFYIGNENLWETDLAHITCKITGLLKEKTEQIYFSEEMGKMMTVAPKNYPSYFSEQNENNKRYLEYTNGLAGSTIYAKIVGEAEEPKLEELEVDNSKIDEYISQLTFSKEKFPIFIINKSLTKNEIIISKELVDTSYLQPTGGACTPVIINNIFMYSIKGDLFISQLEDCKRKLTHVWISKAESEDLRQKIEEMEKVSEGIETFLVSRMETTASTSRVIEISQEMFDYIMGERQSTQMALYIKDYAYTEEVLDNLTQMGYEAASVYQMAALEYDYDVVKKKAVSMAISLGASTLIFFICVFIIGLIMNLNLRDFKIMRLLGLDRDSLNKINTKDIVINMIISVIVSLTIIAVLNMNKIVYIVDIVKYYKLRHYIIYAVVVCAFTLLLSVRSKAKIKKLV